MVDTYYKVTGSLNWTRTAFIGNHENILIIRDADTLSTFQKEYEKMWTTVKANLERQRTIENDEQWD